MVVLISLIFLAAFLLPLAAFLVFRTLSESPAAHLKRRLRRLQAEREGVAVVTSGLLRESSRLEKVLSVLPVLNRIGSLILRSGVSIRPAVLLAVMVVLSVLGAGLGYLVRPVPAAIFLGAAAFLLPPLGYLYYLKQQREKKFDEQLPEVLMMISRSLRAGHSFPSAIELVGSEMAEPAQGLFRVVYEQQQLGMRMADALQSLREKISCSDLNYFVTIVRINSESGGNLSEILDKLAETIKSRQLIRRQVEILTAEGRISGYILMLLPVVIFFVFNVKNPDYMSVFFTEKTCQMMLVIAAAAQAVGFLAVRKIVDIRI